MKPRWEVDREGGLHEVKEVDYKKKIKEWSKK